MEALKLSLTADVASSYTILEYDLAVQMSRRLLVDGLQLLELLAEYGKLLLWMLSKTRVWLQLHKFQSKNTMARNQAMMSLSLGSTPAYININGQKLMQYQIPAQIAAGMPTSIIGRRSDIKQAYYAVEATYANVGVAIANRFPTVTLTGEGGLISSSISDLFKGNPFGWSAAANVTEPIFSFGSKKRGVEIAIEREQQILYNRV